MAMGMAIRRRDASRTRDVATSLHGRAMAFGSSRPRSSRRIAPSRSRRRLARRASDDAMRARWPMLRSWGALSETSRALTLRCLAQWQVVHLVDPLRCGAAACDDLEIVYHISDIEM